MTSTGCKTYKQAFFHVDLFDNFIPEDYALELLTHIDKNAKWNRVDQKKRSNANYGDDGTDYTLELGGGEKNYAGTNDSSASASSVKRTYKVALSRKCYSWSDLPILKQIADMVSKNTGEKVDYVRLQRYPTRKVGLGAHRDKEVKSAIVGLSLGDTRKFTFQPSEWLKEQEDAKSVSLELSSGSLYVIRNPTNDYYSHCVETENEDGGLRISLTFCHSNTKKDE